MPSDTTLDRVRRYLRDNLHRRNLHAAPSHPEEVVMLSESRQAEPEESVTRLEMLEHACLRAIPVPDPVGANALRHFLDGIQRQRILYYEGVVPVFYAYLSAVVRSRVNGRMCCLVPECVRQQDALYAPLHWVDADGLRGYGIPIRDTYAGQRLDALPPHPILLQMAGDVITNDRETLERDLAQTWLAWLQAERPEDWLVVDGSIRDIGVAGSSTRLIGLAKTSVAIERLLTPDQMEAVYGLNKGERSSVFTIERPRRAPLYSWFLRLHDPMKQSLLFGLLRVEMPAVPTLLSEVDKVSGWLLQDRVPLSVPDPRYDRLLYPMRDCEQYLRSIAPSRARVEALTQLVP